MSMWNHSWNNKKIWDLLVENQIISESVLELALNKQVELARKWFEVRIGEILIGAWIIERRSIISFLAKRGIKLRLGEILFLLWMLNEEQYKNIQKIIIENTRNGVSKSIWDIAIELWYITQDAFFDFLEHRGIKLKVGEQLVKEKIISQELLHMVLEEQKRNPAYQWKKLLDILMSMRAITQEQYDKFSWKLWDNDSIEFSFD